MWARNQLFFANIDRRLAAPSEIKALHRFFGRTFSLRAESLLDTTSFDYVPDPYIWYQGLYSVEAGYWVRVSEKSRGITVEHGEYWDFRPPLEPKSKTQRAAFDELQVQLHEAVRTHLVADGEFGGLLSGGVDFICVV